MSDASSSTGYLLLLDSCTQATPPALEPRDIVTVDTSDTSVTVNVDSSTGGPTITGVTAIPLDGAPPVTFTGSGGAFTAPFPSAVLTGYSWRIEVTIAAPGHEREAITLDPIMIVRKTNGGND